MADVAGHAPAPPGTPPGTLTGALAGWAAGLTLADLPPPVVELAKSQVLSQLAAIRAGAAHPLGARLVRAFGPPLQPDPARSACVLAALGSWLNLDDTAYAGHLGPSTVAVPLAYAYADGLPGSRLVAAVVAANECAARLTAAATLGPLRGQSAAHTHLAGAVAGRLHCAGAPAGRWVDALGLALTMPPWPLLRGLLGSDGKLFSALAPVRAAMDACDAALAGLTGAPDIVEHPDGFLRRFATVALPEALTAGLGRRWHTQTLSFKIRPGGPGVDAAVDCAVRLHAALPGLRVEDVRDVTVDASLYTLLAQDKVRDYLDGARSPVGALLLATPYAVATALLTGDLTVADFRPPALDDPRRWALAATVRLRHRPEMTRALLGSVAPFGEAIRQAGARASAWVAEFAGPDLVPAVPPAPAVLPGTADDSFAAATKCTPARVTVRLRDGRSVSRRRDIPVGAAGPQTRAQHRRLVRRKFLASGGPAAVADAVESLERLPTADLAALVEAALG
ncbi:MAG TPA: MmgE/PrpD family protein [Pilimelia sp.]|nr:MmgE/PrpD family protein [Pilimelia sp.]